MYKVDSWLVVSVLKARRYARVCAGCADVIAQGALEPPAHLCNTGRVLRAGAVKCWLYSHTMASWRLHLSELGAF